MVKKEYMKQCSKKANICKKIRHVQSKLQEFLKLLDAAVVQQWCSGTRYAPRVVQKPQFGEHWPFCNSKQIESEIQSFSRAKRNIDSFNYKNVCKYFDFFFTSNYMALKTQKTEVKHRNQNYIPPKANSRQHQCHGRLQKKMNGI